MITQFCRVGLHGFISIVYSFCWKTWSRKISWGRVFHSFKFLFRLYTAVNQYRTNINGTVWLNAGDFFQVSSLIANNCFLLLHAKTSLLGPSFFGWLTRLTSKSFTHMTVAGLRKHQKYILFSEQGCTQKVQKSFDLRADFLCVHQQHITKENIQFFLPKLFSSYWIRVLKKHWK